MHFDLIQSVSLAGAADTPNDDRAGSADGHAWVIDGCTDLGAPGLVGARGGSAWLAAQADAAFTAASDAPIATLCEGVAAQLASAYARACTRPPLDRWELPMASFFAARIDGTMLELGWLGDCAGVLRSGARVTRLGPPRQEKDVEAERAAALAGEGLGSPKRSAPILAELRKSRSRPGLRLLGVEPETMAVLHTSRIACAPGDELLLMSDGFAALVDAYAAYDEVGLIDALDRGGLLPLATRLRAIEAEDSACTRYPRFKTCDDATALWLRIGG